MPKSTVPVQTLLKHGPNYHGDKLVLFEALYAGGDKFEKIKNKLLTKREIENGTGDAGSRSYKLRLERAAYLNRLGGIIDYFTASCMKNNPRIVPQIEGPKAEYWLSLNDDCDGKGTPFSTLCRQVLREMLISARPYVKLNFDNELSTDDASLSLVKAQQVDDWQLDKDGTLEWLRLCAVDIVRPMIEDDANPAMERWTWSYYTMDGVVIYEAEKPVGDDWEQDAVARVINEDDGSHDMEIVPFFDVRVDEGLWLIERLFDGIKALYNREAATQFAIDIQAYATPVLTTDDTASIPSIQASQVLALCLKTGEKFEYVSPNTQVFQALSDDIERLRQSLYEVLQSVAMNAASIPQAGRMSGDAVTAMQSPMTTLIDSFVWPVKDAMTRMIAFLKGYRGDEFEVVLEGFEQELAETDEEDMQDDVKKVIGADGEPVEPDTKEPILSKPADKSGLKSGAKFEKWGKKTA